MSKLHFYILYNFLFFDQFNIFVPFFFSLGQVYKFVCHMTYYIFCSIDSNLYIKFSSILDPIKALSFLPAIF